MNNRILIVAERFYPEEFVINDLAAEWVRRGFSVHVLTQQPSYPNGKVFAGYSNSFYSSNIWNGVFIRRFRTVEDYHKKLKWKLLNYINFVLLGGIVALFTGWKYDRVFIYQTGPLTLSIPGVLIKTFYRRRTVIWSQDIWPDAVYAYGFKRIAKSAPMRWFIKWIYRSCDAVAISCEGFARRLGPYAEGKELHYCPNWAMVDASAPANETIKLSGKLNFTFAGNIGRLQNIENVIRGFGKYISRGGDAQLNIIGGGSGLDSFKAIVNAEKIPNVMFWGRKPASEMPKYLQASDILVISLMDSLLFQLTVPSKFQTYLTAGKPIYCVMHGEVRELTDKYGLGLAAAPSDLHAIADGFAAFAAMSDEDRRKCGSNATELLKKSFDRETIMNRLTSLVTG